MWKRLFIKTPLTLIFVASCLTFIIPFGYWVITGENYMDMGIDYIEYI